MNPLNEDSKSRQPSKTPMDLSTLDQGVMPTLDAATVDASGADAKPKSPRKRIADETPREEGDSKKSRRVGQSKARGEQVIVAQESVTPPLKPAVAKRAQKQMEGRVTAQAEPINMPKRESKKREAKEADARTPVAGRSNDVPPITASAIKYLGKKNATLTDYIKLDPESLAFVRYHLNRTHELEATKPLTGGSAGTKTRPVSPALQKLAEARENDSERYRDNVGLQAAAQLMKLENHAQMSVASRSYRQKFTDYQDCAPVAVRFRKLDLAARKVVQDVQAGEIMLDDRQRLRRLLGTAQTLMAVPTRELAPGEAAALTAADIAEVRAIGDAKIRRLALSAVIDSGMAQPHYMSEFTRQAPDLVELAAEAHRAATADWGLAYEVSNTLGNLVASEIPLTKDETAALARRTIAVIRSIEVPQYREEALAVSHQAGLLHPAFRAEFTHNAPDLVAAADAAYKAQKSGTKPDWKVVHTEENSIQQSPVLLVTKTQPVTNSDRAAQRAPGVRIVVASPD